MAVVTGPDFIALQVRDLACSWDFYTRQSGTPITQPPSRGPFGLQFSCTDPDGYPMTIHQPA